MDQFSGCHGQLEQMMLSHSRTTSRCTKPPRVRAPKSATSCSNSELDIPQTSTARTLKDLDVSPEMAAATIDDANGP